MVFEKKSIIYIIIHDLEEKNKLKIFKNLYFVLFDSPKQNFDKFH